MTSRAQHLRAREIAHHYSLSERTIRRRIADGTLRSLRIGGARLVAKADLERLLSPAFNEEDDATGDGSSKTKIYQCIGKAYRE